MHPVAGRWEGRGLGIRPACGGRFGISAPFTQRATSHQGIGDARGPVHEVVFLHRQRKGRPVGETDAVLHESRHQDAARDGRGVSDERPCAGRAGRQGARHGCRVQHGAVDAVSGADPHAVRPASWPQHIGWHSRFTDAHQRGQGPVRDLEEREHGHPAHAASAGEDRRCVDCPFRMGHRAEGRQADVCAERRRRPSTHRAGALPRPPLVLCAGGGGAAGGHQPRRGLP